MPQKIYYIILNQSKGGWDIRKGASKNVVGHFNTKKDAIKNAREFYKEDGSRLIIFNRYGNIEKTIIRDKSRWRTQKKSSATFRVFSRNGAVERRRSSSSGKSIRPRDSLKGRLRSRDSSDDGTDSGGPKKE